MKDYDLKLKQVLWVEDDPMVIEQYPLKAENFGLQLVAFPCWDEAKAALENDFDHWSAIILDAKCKYHRGSEDNAVVFLREALKDIIKADDVVVELGCHVGNSTRIITQLTPKGKVIALDKSPESPENMKSLMEDQGSIEFLNKDVRLHTTLEDVLKRIRSCDVLSVDLGGGYHPDTTFKVFYIWSSTLKPRETIIRNRGLLDFIHSAKGSETISSSEGWLESCRDDGVPPSLKELKLWSPKV